MHCKFCVNMRLKILLVLLNIVCVLSILPPSNIARLADVPYMVFIRNTELFCGGVILTKDIVLTAAHCIKEKSNLSISAGTLNRWLNKNEQVRNSKNILVREDFRIGVNNVQAFNDVGLIHLDNALELNKFVAPIDWITNSSSIDYNKTATFYGYGYTQSPRQSHSTLGSTTLRVKNMTLILEDECEILIDQAITKNKKQKYEICANAGPCGGDSGSPLVQKIDGITKLIGILSWGVDDDISCDKGPTVYENISFFSEWILKGIEQLLMDKE